MIYLNHLGTCLFSFLFLSCFFFSVMLFNPSHFTELTLNECMNTEKALITHSKQQKKRNFFSLSLSSPVATCANGKRDAGYVSHKRAEEEKLPYFLTLLHVFYLRVLFFSYFIARFIIIVRE